MPVNRHNPKTVPLVGKYTHGVELPPGQRVVYVSGQVGTDAKGKVATGIEKQCDNVWKNIGAVLKSAGMGYADVVKATVYLRDFDEFAAMNGVYRQYFAAEPPTRATVGVTRLAAEYRVEIEILAAR